jgi:hypothetical protein
MASIKACFLFVPFQSLACHQGHCESAPSTQSPRRSLWCDGHRQRQSDIRGEQYHPTFSIEQGSHCQGRARGLARVPSPCGETAPLPHRRPLRHHVNDIDNTNAVVDSHDIREMTIAGPEISTVAFHSEDVPIIRVWETLQHLMGAGCLSLNSSKNCTASICWMSLNARMRAFVIAFLPLSW